jgi:uncharacterized membrane protein
MLISPLLAVVLYAVRPVSFPPNMEASVPTVVQQVDRVEDLPRNFALSPSGTLAVFIAAKSSRGLPSQILISRTDGSRTLLTLPPTKLLSQTLHQYSLGPRGEVVYDDVGFMSIAIGDDDSIFATIGASFSGAVTGAENDVFVWHHGQWHRALPNGGLSDAPGFSIGGATSLRSFSCNVNYSDAIFDMDAPYHDPHYQESWSVLSDGAHVLTLGYGGVTSMSGPFAVGFTPGYLPYTIGDLPFKREKRQAVEWKNGYRSFLGPGTPFGVNARGQAVGSTASSLSLGHPVLWMNGQAIRFGTSAGSAFAISRDGSIVGTLGEHVFLVLGADSSHKVMRIDELLRDSDWQITAAYGISDGGRILAIGRRRGSTSSRMLILDPVNAKRVSAHDKHP